MEDGGRRMEGWRIGVNVVFLDRGTGWEYGRRGDEVAERGSAGVQDDNCTKVGPFGFLMRYCVTILSTVMKHSSLHKVCS